MTRISTPIIFIFLAFNLQARVGCKEVAQKLYSTSLYFQVETEVIFCYCSEEEKRQIVNPIQEKLDTIKKEITTLLKGKETILSLNAYGENTDSEGRLLPIYYHTIKINNIKNVEDTITVSICFSNLSKEDELKKMNKIITKKIKE